jgi:hypothetical protein
MIPDMAPSLVADTSRVFEGAMFRQLMPTPPPKWRKSRLVDDPEIATRSRTTQDAKAIRGVRAAAPTDNWCLEQLFNLVGGNPVASKVLDVVIVPLDLHVIHN